MQNSLVNVGFCLVSNNRFLSVKVLVLGTLNKDKVLVGKQGPSLVAVKTWVDSSFSTPHSSTAAAPHNATSPPTNHHQLALDSGIYCHLSAVITHFKHLKRMLIHSVVAVFKSQIRS